MSSGWIWPVSGKITSPFGQRSKPTVGASTNHMGVDIAAPSGTAVKSAMSGIVKSVGYAKDAGNFVVVDHGDGITTRYQHLLSSGVKSGDRVLRGQSIAKVGSTGISTGAHLHFAMLKDGRYINPETYTRTSKSAEAMANVSDAITDSGIVDLLEQYWYLLAGGLIIVALLSKLGGD